MTAMLYCVALALGWLTLCLGQPNVPSNTAADIAEPGLPIKTPVEVTKQPQKPASYWITYSNTLRPGHPMVFQVQIFEGDLPIDINITVKTQQDVVALSHGPVTVLPRVLQTISIDVPMDVRKPSDDKYYQWAQYKVEVMGYNGVVSIKEKGYASFGKKSFSIFVQTDKAMYKPSQKVQFRTLAMTPDMKVMRDVKQDIIVFDAKENRILQYRGVQASEKLGVVEKSFKLANYVPTGKWKIEVTIEGITESHEFEVNDYVLPRFEVEVDAPSFGINTDLLYAFTVKTKYTFGKPVTDGSVVISIDIPNIYSRGERKPLMRRGPLDSNGELAVTVTLEDLRRLGNSYNDRYPSKEIPSWWTFEITANVTETRTRRTHSGSHSVTFYPSPISMTVLGITPRSFKSGLDFTAYLEVKKKDDTLFTPLELKKMSVMVNVTYTVPETKEPTTTTPIPTTANSIPNLVPALEEDFIRRPGGHWYPQYTTETLELDQPIYSIPETGWIVVTFRVPDEAVNVNLQAKTMSTYEEEVQAYWAASKSHSPTESFIQLSVRNKKPRIGDIIKVQAKSTDDMKLLNYQVFSKGLQVASNQVQGPSKNLAFEFMATASMSPSMSIVAFYVRDDGEFVVDALSLSVDGLFDKSVSLEFSKEKVQPGEPVDLIVKGEQDSLAFLLVVDKSVKLLKTGNDITQDMVRSELASYDFGGYGDWRYMFICGWPSYFGGNDAKAIFQNAGVVVMTDGLVYSRYDDGDYKDVMGEPVPAVPDVAVPEGGETTDSANRGGGLEKPERTRTFFPENWLWNITVLDSSSQAVVPLVSPDTITSWVASVFSVSSQNGLSVAGASAEVTTFRNMFISLDLPTSIMRGEDFCFPASVFSYYPHEIMVILTLEPSTEFSNIWAKREDGRIVLQKEQMYYSHFMGFMKENDVKTVTFCFTPTTVGSIPIRVSALTSVGALSDAVERKIRVKPPGIPHATTMSFLVTPENGVWRQRVPVAFPTDVISDSERISVNIAGNLLGPVFDNLEDLLQKPYGCGEQNMINFSPIMSLVDFFYTTNSITEEFRERAKEYMLIGYQKEILYEHGKTGGYSTFGNHDDTKENPSMWLTAFVTKCFSQAEILDMKYQDILAMDVDLIYRSAMWMVSGKNQNRDGSFNEHGRVFNKNLQGGSSTTGIALTAYTAISLHHALKVLAENNNFKSTAVDRSLSLALGYLERNLNDINDPYDICITTYALTLLDSPYRNRSLVIMQNMAKTGFGLMYWERPQVEKPNNYYWSRGSDAINIEMTSYALLTYSMLGLGTTEGLPIIRWLSKQKGPNGGFISTQDTVIGIEALTSVAKDLYGTEFVPMSVQVDTLSNLGVEDSLTFQVTKDNELILQRKDIPYQEGNEIELSAITLTNQDASKSTVLVDVVLNYNVKSETRSTIYDMNHEIMPSIEGFDLVITIWTLNGQKASMTMLEVEIPAGFDPDMETIKASKNGDKISQMDMKDDILNVYINTDVISEKAIDFKLSMIHTGGKLINPKTKSYKVYNYYEPEYELTKEYSPLNEGDFCSKVPEFGICQYV